MPFPVSTPIFVILCPCNQPLHLFVRAWNPMELLPSIPEAQMFQNWGSPQFYSSLQFTFKWCQGFAMRWEKRQKWRMMGGLHCSGVDSPINPMLITWMRSGGWMEAVTYSSYRDWERRRGIFRVNGCWLVIWSHLEINISNAHVWSLRKCHVSQLQCQNLGLLPAVFCRKCVALDIIPEWVH